MTITSDDGFNTFKVEVLGTLPYVQQFQPADRRVSPVSIPGTSHQTWSVSNPDGTKVTVERVALDGVSLTYLQLGTLYRETPLAGWPYNNEFIVAVLGNSWNRGPTMPLSGSATYNGKSYGIAIVSYPGGGTFRTLSDFQLAANFGGGTVAGSLTNFSFYDFGTGASHAVPSAAGFEIMFDASIAGSSFGGPIRDGFAAIGRTDGQFAGPSAEEVGGAYQVSSAGISAHGVFVGKR